MSGGILRGPALLQRGDLRDLGGDVDAGLIGEQVNAVGKFTETSGPIAAGSKRAAPTLGSPGGRRGENPELGLQLEQQCGSRGVQAGHVRTLGHELLHIGHEAAPEGRLSLRGRSRRASTFTVGQPSRSEAAVSRPRRLQGDDRHQ